MADIENAAKALAAALDKLEQRLEERLHDLSDAAETTALLRRQSGAAHRFAAAAGEDLARAIGDLRSLLDADERKDS